MDRPGNSVNSNQSVQLCISVGYLKITSKYIFEFPSSSKQSTSVESTVHAITKERWSATDRWSRRAPACAYACMYPRSRGTAWKLHGCYNWTNRVIIRAQEKDLRFNNRFPFTSSLKFQLKVSAANRSNANKIATNGN